MNKNWKQWKEIKQGYRKKGNRGHFNYLLIDLVKTLQNLQKNFMAYNSWLFKKKFVWILNKFYKYLVRSPIMGLVSLIFFTNSSQMRAIK